MILNNGTGSDQQNFESKRKQLFDCLNDAEKDLKGTILDQTTGKRRSNSISNLNDLITNDDNKHRSSSSSEIGKIIKFHGKESIFKKPELPIIKCLKPRITPDYQINPHKWKRYSLSDVDTSDHTNTAAAFAFLKDIEIRKDKEQSKYDIDSDQKPVFNKSIRIKRTFESEINCDDKDEIEKPKLKGSKLVMPEYSVGKKSRKEKSLSLIKNDSSSVRKSAKQLRLSHLEDNDDDDNEDDQMED